MIPAISINEMMTIITWRKTFVDLDGLGFRFGLWYRGLIPFFTFAFIYEKGLSVQKKPAKLCSSMFIFTSLSKIFEVLLVK